MTGVGGAPLVVAAWVLLGGALVVLSVIDLRRRLLPFRIVASVGATSAVLLATQAALDGRVAPLLTALGCATATGGALGALHAAHPAGLGLGDVRLAAVIGLDLGWGTDGATRVGLALAVAASLAGVTAMLLLVAARCARDDAVPFGPFLAVGALVAVAAGP